MEIVMKKERSLGKVAERLRQVAPQVALAHSTQADTVVVSKAVGSLRHPATHEQINPFYLLMYYRGAEHVGTMRVIFQSDGRHELIPKPRTSAVI